MLARADDQNKEDAGKGDKQSGLGGDQRFGDAISDFVDGFGAAAGRKCLEGAQHADNRSEESHEGCRSDHGAEEDDAAVDVVDHREANLFKAITNVFGSRDVFLRVTDNLAYATFGHGRIVDPLIPLIFVAKLDVALAHEEQELDAAGINHHSEKRERDHDPAAAQPDAKRLFPKFW